MAELGGYWEYPGGKCEADEDSRECVVREVCEETGLTVQPVRPLTPIDWQYASGALRLYPFLCHILAGEARAVSADEIRWVFPAELREYRFPPANATLNAELIELLSKPGQQ